MTTSFTQPAISPLPTESTPPVPQSSRTRILLIAGGILVTLILLALSVQLYVNMSAPSQQTLSELSPTSVTSDTVKVDESPELPELPLVAGPATTELNIIPATGSSTAQYELNTPSQALITLQSTEPSQEIDGVELVIKYDPMLLDDVRLQPSSEFSTIVRNTVNPELGTISLTMIRQSSESISAGEGITLGTITFTPLQSGDTLLSFDASATLVAGNGGNNILEKTSDLRISIE